MTDEELADALVELRISRIDGKWEDGTKRYVVPTGWQDASGFVRDRHVASAVMELWRKNGGWFNVGGTIDGEHHVRAYTYAASQANGVGTNESLPQAIIEAVVRALQSKDK